MFAVGLCASAAAKLGLSRSSCPHLAIGSPAEIAVAGILQIHAGNLLEAARRIEVGSELVGERLVVNKAVGAGRADGLFVEAFGIELPAFDPRNLGADQRGAIIEIVWGNSPPRAGVACDAQR